VKFISKNLHAFEHVSCSSAWNLYFTVILFPNEIQIYILNKCAFSHICSIWFKELSDL
jgi:hypothetical protein